MRREALPPTEGSSSKSDKHCDVCPPSALDMNAQRLPRVPIEHNDSSQAELLRKNVRCAGVVQAQCCKDTALYSVLQTSLYSQCCTKCSKNTALYTHSVVQTQCCTDTMLYRHSAVQTYCFTRTALYRHSAVQTQCCTDTVLYRRIALHAQRCTDTVLYRHGAVQCSTDIVVLTVLYKV